MSKSVLVIIQRYFEDCLDSNLRKTHVSFTMFYSASQHLLVFSVHWCNGSSNSRTTSFNWKNTPLSPRTSYTNISINSYYNPYPNSNKHVIFILLRQYHIKCYAISLRKKKANPSLNKASKFQHKSK